MDVEVPDKLYFRIGEVSELTSLKPSILRFWETEFDQLKPVKSPAGQRLYTRKNLELVFQIKRLLYTERLTIEGARKRISGKDFKGSEESAKDRRAEILKEIKEDLIRFRDSL